MLLKDPHSIQVDIRYLEFLHDVINEALKLYHTKGVEKERDGERLYRLSIISKTRRQLELIIQEGKREVYEINKK